MYVKDSIEVIKKIMNFESLCFKIFYSLNKLGYTLMS